MIFNFTDMFQQKLLPSVCKNYFENHHFLCLKLIATFLLSRPIDKMYLILICILSTHIYIYPTKKSTFILNSIILILLDLCKTKIDCHTRKNFTVIISEVYLCLWMRALNANPFLQLAVKFCTSTPGYL